MAADLCSVGHNPRQLSPRWKCLSNHREMFVATFDALVAIGGKEPFHPFSIGSAGSFAHSPMDPS
jgi:hypothetical protein